jgi:hypothetical protein
LVWILPLGFLAFLLPRSLGFRLLVRHIPNKKGHQILEHIPRT